MSVAQDIHQTSVERGSLAIFYLAQAGFCFKTSAGTRLLLDPYLTDACNTMFGFKRLIPAPMTPEEARADLLIATHSHADHLDPDALPILAKRDDLRFAGSADCAASFTACGIPPSRFDLLRPGAQLQFRDVELRTVFADHGKLCPTAIGVVIRVEGLVVYVTGDTAYAPERILPSLGGGRVNVMIAPINGRYGNLDARDACRLAAMVKPSILIASHFGMFAEHAGPGGDPATFIKETSTFPPGIQAVVMTPGERMICSRTGRMILSNASLPLHQTDPGHQAEPDRTAVN